MTAILPTLRPPADSIVTATVLLNVTAIPANSRYEYALDINSIVFNERPDEAAKFIRVDAALEEVAGVIHLTQTKREQPEAHHLDVNTGFDAIRHVWGIIENTTSNPLTFGPVKLTLRGEWVKQYPTATFTPQAATAITPQTLGIFGVTDTTGATVIAAAWRRLPTPFAPTGPTSMARQRVTDVADAQDPYDAVNLRTAIALQESPVLPNVGTPGTYGSAGSTPQITTDAKGRVSVVTLLPATNSPALRTYMANNFT